MALALNWRGRPVPGSHGSGNKCVIGAGVLEGGARCASLAEPGTGADALQLTRRFSFRARLTAGVRQQSVWDTLQPEERPWTGP